MLNCGLGVILGRERCPPDLEGSSSGHLLLASISLPPLLHFLCYPPSPPPSPPGPRGAGQAVIPPCPEGGPAHRSPRGRWAGPLLASSPWGCLERATPAGRKGVPMATEAGRQPDLPYYRTPGSCLFRRSYREPSKEYDLLDPLGGDDCMGGGERHPAISRPSGSTAVSSWPVALAGPCSAGISGLPPAPHSEPGGGSWQITF